MVFEILEGKELLAAYGLAVLECNKVEMYTGAILQQNNEPKIPDTFGPKISLVDKYISNKEVISDLSKLNLDRILLAHGFALKNPDNSIYLVSIKNGKANNHSQLTEMFLEDIYNRAVRIGELLIRIGNLKEISW